MDKPHKKLDVWKLSMVLSKVTYDVTSGYPDGERFGLVSQMRRTAVSIPGNLAEGAARTSENEFRHFLSITRNSMSEVDTHYDLSRQLGLIEEQVRADVDALMVRIDKMLHALQRSFERPRDR
jgi:four helix bundle protein